MRTPGRRPRRKEVFVPPGTELGELAARVRDVGSSEHKSYASPAGAPQPRRDATKCDPAQHGDFRQLSTWLQDAVRAGRVGSPWEGHFPRYVWTSQGGTWYEGRLVNREQGTYKGYAVRLDEVPEELLSTG